MQFSVFEPLLELTRIRWYLELAIILALVLKRQSENLKEHNFSETENDLISPNTSTYMHIKWTSLKHSR